MGLCHQRELQGFILWEDRRELFGGVDCGGSVVVEAIVLRSQERVLESRPVP